MNIATGSILNLAPAGHDWVIAFDLGDETGPEIVCPLIGWATVVEAHLNDGTATTCVQPAFLYVDMVWTPNELREHNPAASGFEVRAREITQPVTKVQIVEPTEQEDDRPEVRVFHREAGWTINPEHGVETCTSNFYRQQDGRPACTDTAVWKVVQECGYGLSIGFYCDTDLPAEYSGARELTA
ncbi:hypothetical protein ABZ446_01850 [Streptomyces sp. NPDC005813]|uniref:hypothetical protein n=1 Tax=Streptomyces sp. NPDC005813 TaxID=3155592 RepID=UPI0034081D89